MEISRRIETIKTTALLRSARILRKILETWGDLLSLWLRWRTTRCHWREKFERSGIITINNYMKSNVSTQRKHPRISVMNFKWFLFYISALVNLFSLSILFENTDIVTFLIFFLYQYQFLIISCDRFRHVQILSYDPGQKYRGKAERADSTRKF